MGDESLEEMLDPFRLDGRFFETIYPGGKPLDDIDTFFMFTQVAEIIHADYFGGQVRMGKLLGTREGQTIRFRFMQINRTGEFRSGQTEAFLSLDESGKLRLELPWHFDHFEDTAGCYLRQYDPSDRYRNR
jgi:hypothetical protein